uniref:Secreted protein n=1 Tax=Macrostomum lignano TaxID=282301 RepID=A0A1I8FD83_9PLAT
MLLLCALAAVGLVWAFTNALMRRTAADTSDSKAWSLGALLRNWKVSHGSGSEPVGSLLFLVGVSPRQQFTGNGL